MSECKTKRSKPTMIKTFGSLMVMHFSQHVILFKSFSRYFFEFLTRFSLSNENNEKLEKCLLHRFFFYFISQNKTKK